MAKHRVKFPFMGGTVYATAEATAPRHLHVEGRLVYGNGTVSWPFKADIEAAVMIKTDQQTSELISRGGNVIAEIVQFMRTATGQVGTPPATNPRGRRG
jgi:hypothetical protein